jgi:hypothetical protein
VTTAADQPAAGAAEKVAAIERLQRALQGFQAAQAAFLAAHRKAQALPSDDADCFWATQGGGIEAKQTAAAAEVDAAFKAFSKAGLVASASDRHLANEARRALAGD